MNLIETVIKHNDYKTNVTCCIEEMSELTHVLCKQQRESDKFSCIKLAEELAHVLLMCGVIAGENNISIDELEYYQINAVNRMERGIK